MMMNAVMNMMMKTMMKTMTMIVDEKQMEC